MPAFLVGLEVVWTITDGGSPGEGNDSATYIYAGAGVGPRRTVRDDPGAAPASNVLTGNFTVHEEN